MSKQQELDEAIRVANSQARIFRWLAIAEAFFATLLLLLGDYLMGGLAFVMFVVFAWITLRRECLRDYLVECKGQTERTEQEEG